MTADAFDPRQVREQLLAAIEASGVEAIRDHAREFRELYHLDRTEWQQVWVVLEHGGMPREEMAALLEGQDGQARPAAKIKDLNDALRAYGAGAVRKAMELAERELQVKATLVRVRVEQLLGHLGDGGSISDGDYAARFREAHRLDPRAAQPVWAELERRGMSRDAIVAVLNEKNQNGVERPAELPPPVFPDVDKDRHPKRTFANARVAIGALGITCRYDEFHSRLLVGGRVIEQWAGELDDQVVIMLRNAIVRDFKFDPGRDHTRDAGVALSLENAFDPVINYLDAVKWDGISRLDTWLMIYLGAADTPLNRAIGRLTLVAAVRRARKPGCKWDVIVVLESDEGHGKSTAILILAGPENFSDQTILPLNDREQQEAMAGIWIFEIADLSGISKADVDRVKAFASRTVDRAPCIWLASCRSAAPLHFHRHHQRQELPQKSNRQSAVLAGQGGTHRSRQAARRPRSALGRGRSH